MTFTSKKDNLLDKFVGTSRYGGILLHPTSLPGEYGIGDLGPEVYKFIDFLNKYKQNLWQILPLGPTGYGNSPYQCFSAFAGNPLIISPEKLCEIGLLTNKEWILQDRFPESSVDYERVIPYKWQLLEFAFKNYKQKQPWKLDREFSNFMNKHSFWLDDYSLFMSIKKAHHLRAWNEWDEDLRFRDTNALERWKKDYENEIEFQKFTQFIFFKQWNEVKSYANLKDILIIGDIPIFVAYDSVDVWAHPEFYYLNDKRDLLYVAGVPPDYFSSTGQRWGNPLYNWNLLKKQGYRWWIQRIKHNLDQVDILRIDHFRGFESYWQIEVSEATAEVGEWILGPGIDLFLKMKEELGSLPIIAEDLGIITPEVEDLLQQTGFPGMRVLQFAFGDKDQASIKNKYLPHYYLPNTIAYTGTHDNSTTKAWFEKLTSKIKKQVLDYINSDGKDVVGDLIRLAWSSVASMAIIPLQDLLRLGDEARMNLPGTLKNNWEWRFTLDQVTRERGRQIKNLSRLYDRILPVKLKDKS
ncbi:MAG: 4-alpha-glucanotransferase [Promethearchaeota archaeon]